MIFSENRSPLFGIMLSPRPTEASGIMSAYWIGVASADHVRRRRKDGFMQVNHGKAAPLKRMKPGDGIVYYSPTVTYGGKDKLRAFTAIGTAKDRQPYIGEMGSGFTTATRD